MRRKLGERGEGNIQTLAFSWAGTRLNSLGMILVALLKAAACIGREALIDLILGSAKLFNNSSATLW